MLAIANYSAWFFWQIKFSNQKILATEYDHRDRYNKKISIFYAFKSINSRFFVARVKQQRYPLDEKGWQHPERARSPLTKPR
jgi:hypothetical protein